MDTGSQYVCEGQAAHSRARAATILVNVAVTDFAAVILTLHVGVVSVQAPDQPVKVEPLLAVAVSVTRVPAA